MLLLIFGDTSQDVLHAVAILPARASNQKTTTIETDFVFARVHVARERSENTKFGTSVLTLSSPFKNGDRKQIQNPRTNYCNTMAPFN